MLKRLNTLTILHISIIIMLMGIESFAISAVSDDVAEIKSLLSRYQQGYQTKNIEVIKSCFEALGTVEEAKLKNQFASIEPISLTFTNIYIKFLTEPPRAYDAQLTCDAILAYTEEGETTPKQTSQRYSFGLVQKESANALKEWKIRAMDIIERDSEATMPFQAPKDTSSAKPTEVSIDSSNAQGTSNDDGMIATTSSRAASAQGLKGGFKSGLNVAKIVGKDSKEAMGSKIGSCVGGFITYRINDIWSIQPEALFTTKGSKQELKSFGSTTMNLKYLEFPFLVKLSVLKQGNYRLNLFVGPYLAIKLSSSLEGYGVDSNIKGLKDEDFGLVSGCGVDIGKSSFEVRASLGATTFDDTGLNLKNKVISFMAAFSF